MTITDPETTLRLEVTFNQPVKIKGWNIRFVKRLYWWWPLFYWWPAYSLKWDFKRYKNRMNASEKDISIVRIEQQDLTKGSRIPGYEAKPEKDEAGGWFANFGDKPYPRDKGKQMTFEFHVDAPVRWKGTISLRITIVETVREETTYELDIFRRLPVEKT